MWVIKYSASGQSIYEDDTTRLVAYELADIQAVFVDCDTDEARDFVKEHAE